MVAEIVREFAWYAIGDQFMVEWQGGRCRSDAPNLFEEMPGQSARDRYEEFFILMLLWKT